MYVPLGWTESTTLLPIFLTLARQLPCAGNVASSVQPSTSPVRPPVASTSVAENPDADSGTATRTVSASGNATAAVETSAAVDD